MKRFLLSFLLFLSLGSFVIAQENPCPTISNIKVNNDGDPDNDGICEASISFDAKGDVQSQKGVQVEVFCNNGTTPILTQCYPRLNLPLLPLHILPRIFHVLVVPR